MSFVDPVSDWYSATVHIIIYLTILDRVITALDFIHNLHNHSSYWGIIIQEDIKLLNPFKAMEFDGESFDGMRLRTNTEMSVRFSAVFFWEWLKPIYSVLEKVSFRTTDNIMRMLPNGKICPVTGPLCRKITGLHYTSTYSIFILKQPCALDWIYCISAIRER